MIDSQKMNSFLLEFHATERGVQVKVWSLPSNKGRPVIKRVTIV
jgi:hypothetical protein